MALWDYKQKQKHTTIYIYDLLTDGFSSDKQASKSFVPISKEIQWEEGILLIETFTLGT